ncbi:hypothetical protein EVA_16469 [gut metagenome]|uniref:Uncharacterized protein n=1 Tax=gut metagenome TaxID=749906 RepID=J9G0U2_9ZZZZ
MGKKKYSDPNKRSIEEIVVSEMNMDTVRSILRMSGWTSLALQKELYQE